MTAVNEAAGPPVGGISAEAKVEAAEARHACANCGTPVERRYCPECGQKAHLHTRLSHLLEELAEGIAHFDGRLWRTLPLLVLRPGRLSREWREGRRARYVPPLHLFLFGVFVYFTVIAVGPDRPNDEPVRPAERAERRHVPPPSGGLKRALHDTSRWLDSITSKYDSDHKYYSYKANNLLYKTAPAAAPIAVAILWLLLVRRKELTLYDHTVVALYGLSTLILGATLLAVPAHYLGDWLWLPFWGLMYLHAIVHLHGAYRLSWLGAVLRGLALGGLTAIGFLIFGTTILVLAVSG